MEPSDMSHLKLGGADEAAKNGAARRCEEGVALLDDVAAFLRRYVVMSEAQQSAAALWVAHTHAFNAADATPYLHVTSAERESGKTRLLEAFEQVVARPWLTARTTAAALVRKVAADPPATLLLDESDNTLKADREYVAVLSAVLNAGYRQGGSATLCVGQGAALEVRDFPVFAPKALAGIGELPDTVASRSIRIELKRRAPGEHVERFRRRDVEAEAAVLDERLAAWAAEHADVLANARPELPEKLGDRAADVWEPLLAIADLAGGGWSERARRAAVELSADKRADDDSIGVRLLADIERVFDASSEDRIPTVELLRALHADDEGPWADWYGKPLGARVLSDMLKRFGIRSRSVRLPDGTTPKGYLREQFEDAWNRYLPPETPPERHDATTGTDAATAAIFDPLRDAVVADAETGANPDGSVVVAHVADQDRGGRPDTSSHSEDDDWDRWLFGDEGETA
jgi:Protein of unknown function (DUF3631)